MIIKTKFKILLFTEIYRKIIPFSRTGISVHNLALRCQIARKKILQVKENCKQKPHSDMLRHTLIVPYFIKRFGSCDI